MNEKTTQENQQELFSEFSSQPQKRPDRLPGLHKTHKPILINTNIEQLILAGIVVVLVACFMFFLGMIRGRALRGDQPVSSAATQTQLPAAAVPTAAPVPAVSATRVAALAKSAAPIILDAKKPYTIQLASYKKREHAEKEAAVLRSGGYLPLILPSGDYFIVCAGQYAGKDEAKRDLKFFATRYKDCFLRPR